MSKGIAPPTHEPLKTRPQSQLCDHTILAYFGTRSARNTSHGGASRCWSGPAVFGTKATSVNPYTLCRIALHASASPKHCQVSSSYSAKPKPLIQTRWRKDYSVLRDRFAGPLRVDVVDTKGPSPSHLDCHCILLPQYLLLS
jgi:hypothetical protein